MDHTSNYVINFQANLDGVDKVKKQFESIMQMEGVSNNLTKPMQEAWNKLQGRMNAFITQMKAELSKPNPDISMLKTLDKELTTIITKANNFNVSLQGINLPKDIGAQLDQITKKINDAMNEINRLQNANLKLSEGLDSRTKTGFKKGSNAENLAFLEQRAMVPNVDSVLMQIPGSIITGWEQYKNAVEQAIESQQLVGDEAIKAKQTIIDLEAAIKNSAENKQTLIKTNETQIETQRQAIDGYEQEKNQLIATANASQELTQAQKNLNESTQQNAININKLAVQQQRTKESLIQENNNVQNTNSSMLNLADSQDKVAKSTNTLTSTFGKAARQVITYGTIVNLLRQAYQRTIDTVTNLDKAFTDMAVVTNMSRNEAWELVSTMQSLATETGKTSAEIANITTKFLQQGKSISQALELTEAAAKAATIAGINGEQSVDLLTNALNGFQMSASQAMEVSDKFAALAAASATDYEELATALSKVAAQANLAGMSMDFTLGLLAKGIEVTREAPETIGTALKTVVARMRELSDYGKTLEEGTDVNRVAAALSNVGIELMNESGQFRDLEDVLTDVGIKWNTLNKNQQANIAVAMAGTRQQSRFIAMMQDFDRTQELVDISSTSLGATLSQQAKYMGGMEAATNNLTVAWEQLITTLINSNIIIDWINGLSEVVGFFTTMVDTAAAIVPILVAVGALTLGALSAKIQEATLQAQINEYKRQEQILENESVIASQKAAAAERKNQREELITQKKILIQEKEKTKENIKQAKLANEELIKQKKSAVQTAISSKNIALASQLQAEITELEQQNIQYNNQRNQINKEIRQEKAEIQALENVSYYTEAERLTIQQQELANQRLELQQYGQMAGIIGAITGLLQIGQTLKIAGQVIDGIKLAFKAKEYGIEKDITAEKLKQQGIEKSSVAINTANALLGAAKSAPWMVAVALIALAGVAGITAAAIANANKNEMSASEEAAERLKELQVEVYNLAKSQETVKKLGDEFETLSTKINQSTEDAQRLDEIIQQINDEGGNITATTRNEQLRQIRGYEGLLETKKQYAIQEQASTIEKGYSSVQTKTYIDENGWYRISKNNSKEAQQARKNLNLSDVSYRSYLNKDEADKVAAEITKEAQRIYTQNLLQSSGDVIKQLTAHSVDLSKINNAQLQDAIVNSSIEAFDLIFQNGEFDYSVFNKLMNGTLLQGLDTALSSNSLVAIDQAVNSLEQLSDATVEYLAKADPFIALFAKDGKLKGSGALLEELGINLTELSNIQSSLGTEYFDEWLNGLKKIASEENKLNLSTDQKKQKLLDNYMDMSIKRQNEIANMVASFNQKEFDQKVELGQELNEYEKALLEEQQAYALYQAKQTAYNEAQKALDDSKKKSNKSKYRGLESKLAEVEKEVSSSFEVYDSARKKVEDFVEAANTPINVDGIRTLVDSLYDIKESTEVVDMLTTLVSKVERLSEAFDWANLPLEKQLELLREYPEIAKYVSDGIFSVDEQVKMLEQDVNNTKSTLQISMTGLKEEFTRLNQDAQIDTSVFTLKSGIQIDFDHLFDENDAGTELRARIATLNEEDTKDFINKYMLAMGIDPNTATQVEIDAVTHTIQEIKGIAQLFNEQGQTLSNLSIDTLIDEGSAEAFNQATNWYQKQIDQIEELDKKLSGLDTNSAEFQETWNARQKLLIDNNSMALSREEDLYKMINQTLQSELAGDIKLADYIEEVNGKVYLKNEEEYNKLDASQQQLIKIGLTRIEGYYGEINDIQDQVRSNNELFAQNYIDLEVDNTQQLINELEKRKEAYENYFDKLDALEEEQDRKQNRESLLKQIEALSGGADAASKQRLKELQQQLNDLDTEAKQAQKEAQRDALLSDMDAEIEQLDNTMNMLNDSVQGLISVLEGTASPETAQKYTHLILDMFDGNEEQIKALIPDQELRKSYGFKFARGGLVDYTGPAWVDGTKSNPEAFLSAFDTRLIQNLVSQLALNRTVNTDVSQIVSTNQLPIVIENITIQTNELNQDQDWRNAGQTLAAEFENEQRKRGINQNVNTRYRR